MTTANEITLKNIPGAEDKDKDIIVDGEVVGTVLWGFIRSGARMGDQWIAMLPGQSAFGEINLKDIKSAIAHKL